MWYYPIFLGADGDFGYAQQRPDLRVIHHYFDLEKLTDASIEAQCNIETLLMHGLVTRLRDLRISEPVFFFLQRREGKNVRISHQTIDFCLSLDWLDGFPGYMYSDIGALGPYCTVYAVWDGEWMTRHHFFPRDWKPGYPFIAEYQDHFHSSFTYRIFQVAPWRANEIARQPLRYLRFSVLRRQPTVMFALHGETIVLRQRFGGFPLRSPKPTVEEQIGTQAWAVVKDATRIICLYLFPLAEYAFNEDSDLGMLHDVSISVFDVEQAFVEMEQLSTLPHFIDPLYRYFRLIEKHDIALMVFGQLYRIANASPEHPCKDATVNGSTLRLMQHMHVMGSCLLGAPRRRLPKRKTPLPPAEPRDPWEFRENEAERFLRLVRVPEHERIRIIAHTREALRRRELQKQLLSRRN